LSGAPPTTALRWLDYPEKEKLVAREPNPTDRRTEFVEITEKGRSAMAQYLFETLELLI
jgi:DNA-binding MarR family transcriptional regulator